MGSETKLSDSPSKVTKIIIKFDRSAKFIYFSAREISLNQLRGMLAFFDSVHLFSACLLYDLNVIGECDARRQD